MAPQAPAPARAARRPRAAPLLALLAAATAAAPQIASGHGVMLQPPSRNWNAYLEWNFLNAHGLNGGGAKVMSNDGKLAFPNGRRNYCGDAFNETKWDSPRSVTTTYVTGQTINLDVVVAVNHLGRFEVEICPLDAKPGQGKCQSLTLAAPNMKGVKHWYMPGVDKWTGGNYGGEGPRYGDGTYSAYKLPPIPRWNNWGCKSQELCNMFSGMWVYRTQWALPQGFKCDHCKLQWTWTTGHSCWPPCDPGNPQAACQNKQVYPTCGTPGSQYPEQFYNCADVRVMDNGKVDAATNFPIWNSSIPTKEIASGVWGTIRMPVMNEGVGKGGGYGGRRLQAGGGGRVDRRRGAGLGGALAAAQRSLLAAAAGMLRA